MKRPVKTSTVAGTITGAVAAVIVFIFRQVHIDLTPEEAVSFAVIAVAVAHHFAPED